MTDDVATPDPVPLLYLSAEKKMLSFERLAGAMAEDGFLMLGAGETVIGQTRRFEADSEARGLYRRSSTESPQIAVGA